MTDKYQRPQAWSFLHCVVCDGRAGWRLTTLLHSGPVRRGPRHHHVPCPLSTSSPSYPLSSLHLVTIMSNVLSPPRHHHVHCPLSALLNIIAQLLIWRCVPECSVFTNMVRKEFWAFGTWIMWTNQDVQTRAYCH